jgi:hypothetical protein
MNILTIISLIIGTFLSLFASIAHAQEQTVEWAPFIKKLEVSDQQLITAAAQVQSGFLSLQTGFVKRVLIKKNTSEYADIVYWKTAEAASAAAGNVANCDVCNAYFSLMDMSNTQKMLTSFTYYKVLENW